MRRIVFLLFAAFAFNSCIETPEFGSARESAYSFNFEKKYGKIDPNQDWGFGKVEAPTRGVIEDFLGMGMVLPKTPSHEEITKVHEWFNTHPNPATLSLDWCDYWIVPIKYSEHSHYMSQVYIGEKMNAINGWHGWGFLVEDGNTKEFKYHNSLTGEEMTDKHAIQKIDGKYYLGFYFYGRDKNGEAVGDDDNLYNDWIFRLEPAVYKDTYRIIAEDLGNTGDFDFNDVVFDFRKGKGGYTVTLQAAGGTLPLYIGGKEVHEAFGVSQGTFVNTDGFGLPPVMFKVNSIDITVKASRAVTYTLKSECGKAPQKICVPTDYEWTKECESIEVKYPKFKDWVGTKDVDWIE